MNDINQKKFIENSVLPISISGMEKIIEQMKKCVCKIHKKNGKEATGFFCKIPFPDNSHLIPLLITNNHILDSNDIVVNSSIIISVNDEKEYKCIIIIDESRKVFTSKELDVTFIEIKENEDKIYNFLELDEKINENSNILNEIYNQKSVYILNYQEGNNILASYGIISNINNNLIYHKCITKEGSSGSPILLLNNFKVIGIHRGYTHIFNFNNGIFIQRPIIEFLNNFNNIKKNNDDNNKNEIKKVDFNNNIYNEMNIFYEIKVENKIKIFGKNFVDNNRNNCKIIINNKERKICEYLNINENMRKNDKLKIKLKEIKTITDMSYMFCGCSSLISIPDISNWNTSKVENMSFLFGGNYDRICEKKKILIK